jgi:calcyclin binding protein
MVEIEQVEEEETTPTPTTTAATPLPSQERLWDAEAIEQAATTMSRPTAKMHLEALAKKLRKESDALKRLEADASSQTKGTGEQQQQQQQHQPTTDSSPAAPAPAPTLKSVAAPPMDPPKPLASALPFTTNTSASSAVKYTSIDRFAFDAGKYDAPFVSVYIDLPTVGSIPKDQISCDFTKSSFDLVVRDLRGKSYRLFKDHLEKDIVVAKSTYKIKADKIIVKLARVKGEYGSYDYWSQLTDSKKKEKKSSNENPSAGIMDLMKDMYEKGDEKTRKMIGETMMKQRNGELDSGMDKGMGMGGLGDLGSGDDDDDGF